MFSCTDSESGDSDASALASNTAPSLKVNSLMKHCALEVRECVLEAEYRTAANCTLSCLDMWDEDTTSGKYHVENCSNLCAFSYSAVSSYVNFLQCAWEIISPPIPSKCRAPQQLKN